MPIDDKPPSAWDEADLVELCEEQRREGPRLEFKRELNLDTEGQKHEAERDAQGMANAGGGVIVYGIEEVELLDGGTGAGACRPLEDGTLYERLNSVLDARGEPRLVFDLHSITAASGGTYLVLDISGRRRPHQCSDGRYHMRRGTQVRRMSEAEVQEAYRDKLLREAAAARPILSDRADTELPPDVAARVHRGLSPAQMALRTDETGEMDPPGWLSVIVLPDPAREGILDPVRDAPRFSTIDIPDRWDLDHFPLQFFHLRPTMEGLSAQLPPRDDVAPAYLVAFHRDGVMEYGTTLEPGLRHDDPAQNRVIFSLSHTFAIHDYLQAFGVALGELGYEGPVAAQASFDHTQGVNLGVSRDRGLFNLHPIGIDRIRGRLWRLERDELIAQAGIITKQVMDLVFLAAGITTGCWLITDDGRLAPDALR